MRVRIKGVLSKLVSINGLPQGAVLSVILFIITINHALHIVKSPLQGHLFVDDQSITCWGKNVEFTFHIVQKTLNDLQDWADSCGFKFSAAKSDYMIIGSQKGTKNKNLGLFINNQPLQEKDSTKILGLTIDKNLTWEKHIKTLKNECQNRMRILKVLANKQWGGSTELLLRVYRCLIRSKLDYGAIIYDSASKSLLDTLQPIVNSACRICLGAFRTSPAASLLAEAGELPLAVRRKELCIKYAVSIATTPNNPAYHCIYKNVPPNDDLNYNAPESLRLRIARYTAELGLHLPTVYKRSLGYFPPWESLQIPMNLDLSDHDRPTSTNEIFRTLFCEMRDIYSPCIEYYTDGSVCNGKTGYAVISNSNPIVTQRSHDYNSIFTCEAKAILHTLEIIQNRQDNTNSTIFTDSMSCLRAIQNIFTQNPIIQSIHQILDHLRTLKKQVSLVWIPAHTGIPGNEEADQAAKAATAEECPPDSPVTLTEANKIISKAIKNQWNTMWLQRPSKLHDVRNNISEVVPTLDRWEQTVLTRIRIGHTNLTHSYLISKKPQNLCQRCNSPISVKHLLIDCSDYQQDRERAGLTDDLPGMLTDYNKCKKNSAKRENKSVKRSLVNISSAKDFTHWTGPQSNYIHLFWMH
ncbi:uncharacterized protein LOC123270829 [Cotesia glomerata]|uniref:uncharacterized protein LOC123270829 n=1 Tax=Cotesia glomerata TaxID=32391 RepID=UPI001D0033D8|nr:uncharacterized protein LOC123270829 [Cotesia glomerata]